jgi:hypothetical protein
MGGKKRPAYIPEGLDNVGDYMGNTRRRVAAKRTRDGTKDNYKSHIKKLIAFLQENHPECLDEDLKVILPVNEDVFMTYMASNVTQATERLKYVKEPLNCPPGIPEPFASSNISGCRSALVDLYTQKDMKLSETLDVSLTGFISKCLDFFSF